MNGVTVRLQGERELHRTLREVASGLSNAREMFRDIGAVEEKNINLRFDLKRDPRGTAWPAHRPATRERYAKEDGGRRAGTLLERTGRMRASLSSRATNNQVQVGFGRPYAIWPELGTRKMQRRGMLTADPVTGELGKEDRDDILGVVASYVGGLFT